MSPHQDVLDHCFSVTLSSSSSFIIIANLRQAVPKLRPPIIRSCRDQTPYIDSKYDLARSGWVGYSVVAEWVANSNVAINGEWYGDPDGGMDGGEFQNLNCVV